jgi:agmatine deiminase
MSPTPETPAALGFAMPPEWAPHRATWIAWPHHAPDWPGKFASIPWVYGEFVRHLTRTDGPGTLPPEKAAILVADAAEEKKARALLAKVGVPADRYELHRHPTDRVWTRDYAPIFIKNNATGEIAGTNWKFNGWAKYPNHKKDDAIAGRVAKSLKRREFVARVPDDSVKGGVRQVVLEGGAIDCNGAGTLLATEECLLSDVQARNPGLGREGTERALNDFLGARKVIWLGRGIAGDDTHGHIDDLARFVSARTVVCCAEPARTDENHAALAENLEILRGATNADGDRLDVVELPMPAPLVFEGVRLPASYANFYISNRAVLMPTFNDPNDCKAHGILRALFPDRQVIGIHAVDLVWGLGTLHCMTQQEPL